MQINQVAQSLEALQRELEQLAPIVNHIEAAQAVTAAAQLLPEQQKAALAAHLAEQKREVDKVVAELKQSAAAVAQAAEDATNNSSDTIKTIKTEHAAGIESLQKASEKLVSTYKDLTTELQTTLKKQGDEVTAEIADKSGVLAAASDRVNAYQEVVEKIDFPTRLDKLDVTVAGIMAATQTTQGRVDNLERSIIEKFGALLAQNEKTKEALLSKLDTANKSARTLLIVFVVLSVLLIAAVIYLIIRP